MRLESLAYKPWYNVFSHNKSVNNTFQPDFLTKRTGPKRVNENFFFIMVRHVLPTMVFVG
jgi:hypothetical protein